MNRTTGLFWLLPLLLLLESSCSLSPSERKPLEHTWKDGPQPICIAPPADVMVKGVNANADLAAAKIGTLLKGTGGVSIDIDRIRREVPEDVAAFEVVDYRLCLQYGNQVISKEEYLSFTKQVLPAIKKHSPGNPISSVGTAFQPSLLTTCQESIVGIKRQPKIFVPAWRSVLERLHDERITYDLRNLFEVWGRIPVGLTGKDLIHEAIYTLNCLEKTGELRLEKLNTTSTYWGENFENQNIAFVAPSISNSNEWRRLTDSDRTQLSLILSSGSRYKIEIFRTPTPDCIRLANDFYDLFTQMEWTIPHKPQMPRDYEPEPGIRVKSIGDNIPSAPIKNMKERSGALLLVQALEKIKLPVMYEARGGMIEDLTIHLEIGMKPERN